MSNQEKQSKTSEDERLRRFLRMFDNSWKYASSNYHTQWDEYFKLYQNKRVHRSHDGVVSVFVPMVRSSVDTIVASLFNSNPSVNYTPNYRDQEQDTKVLNELYADFARQDGWVQKNKDNGRQGIITGNMVSYYEYVNNKNGGYVHKINVPIRDMVIDPNSHGLEDCEYVGRRFETSLKALKEAKIYDVKAGKEVPRYTNLDKVTVGSGKSTGSEFDKQRKEASLGSTNTTDNNRIEIIEIWTRKEVAVIAGRSVLIEYRENPHYAVAKAQFEQRKAEHELAKMAYEQELARWNSDRSLTLQSTGEDIGEFQGEVVGEFDESFDETSAGLLPFAHGRIYRDISLPYGSGDVEIIADLQELLNELTELNIEAGLFSVFPEKTIDPKFASSIDDLDPFPGKIYPVPKGAMEWNTPPTIPNNIFNERLNTKDEIREAISVSQISKGVSATDTTTATEIKALMGNADTRIQEKAQTLANDFFAQEASIVLKLVQLYAPESMWVRTAEDANVSFQEINPRKFLGEYSPMVTLDIQRKLEEAEKREAYMQAYKMLIADPTNNLAKVKEYCLPKILVDMSTEQIVEMTTQPEPTVPEMALPTGVDIEEPIVESQIINNGDKLQ